MKPFTAKTILTVLIILAAQSGHAVADSIYFDFSSQLSSVPNSVAQNNYGTLNFTPASPAGDGSAWLYSSQGTHVAGPSSINIASLGWQVPSDPFNVGNDTIAGTPSTFNAQAFQLALTLTDAASHAQGTLQFQGTFSGTQTQGTLSFAPSIQTLLLGHNTYTVDLSHQTSWATDPDHEWMMMAAYGGGYNVPAQVTVQPLSVQAAPEPTSLTLAALGLVTILGSGLRRGRRRELAV